MNVGDYVRVNTKTMNKYVGITRLESETDYAWYFEDLTILKRPDRRSKKVVDINDFNYKSSPNIIDLIEYGDIVKYKIDDEEFISEVWGEKNDYFVQNFDVPIDLRDLNIVSIVTKECFESMEYKVGK